MKSARNHLYAALITCVLGVPGAHAASPVKLLVRDAYIFSMADGQREPFHGYFTVDGQGKLIDVAAGEPPRGLHAAATYDAGGHWVMPGFISAHSHLWQAAYRGLAQDKTLPGWIDALYVQTASRAKPQDFYWFTLDGALDHLDHGITAAYNFNYGDRWSSSTDGAIDVDRIEFNAETDSGIRFVHGIQPGAAAPDKSLEGARRHLKGFLDWTAAQPHNSNFLSVMLNGGAAFRDSDHEAYLETALMKEFHLANQTHYLEPPDTVTADQPKFQWFVKSGLLTKHLIFGHFIHTTPDIIGETAKAGGSMVWNPLSNGRLASGTADIPAYLKAGIRVGMGVDGEASADLADPFENLRTGLYAIRDKYQSAAIMSPYDVLRLHTVGSADVLEVADRLGSLQPGKFADFLVIDPSHFAHIFDPYAALVFVTSGRDLERVYVGGREMVDHGRLLHQDGAKVEAESDRRVAQSLSQPPAPIHMR